MIKLHRFTTRKCHLMAYALIGATSFAEPAMAQSLQPLENIADFFVGALTGDLARSLAIIAVVALGLMAWFGRLRAAIALSVILGIALVFGATSIVDSIGGSV